jgi:hemoglobin
MNQPSELKLSTKSDILTEADCVTLVHTFYERVQQNDRLNYIFNDFAHLDWTHHLPKMIDFWSNIILQTGRYKGNPYQSHLHLPIREQDFSLWLSLFHETVDDLFTGERANHAKNIAEKVADMFVMRMKMDGFLPFKPTE